MLRYTSKFQTRFRLLRLLPNTVFDTQKVSTNSFWVRFKICISESHYHKNKLCMGGLVFVEVLSLYPVLLGDGNKTPNWARASSRSWHLCGGQWKRALLPLSTYRHHFSWGPAEEEKKIILAPGPKRWTKQLSKIHCNGFVIEEDEGQVPCLQVCCLFLLPLASKWLSPSALLTVLVHCQSPSAATSFDLPLHIHASICNNSKEAQLWNSFF